MFIYVLQRVNKISMPPPPKRLHCPASPICKGQEARIMSDQTCLLFPSTLINLFVCSDPGGEETPMSQEPVNNGSVNREREIADCK